MDWPHLASGLQRLAGVVENTVGESHGGSGARAVEFEKAKGVVLLTAIAPPFFRAKRKPHEPRGVPRLLKPEDTPSTISLETRLPARRRLRGESEDERGSQPKNVADFCSLLSHYTIPHSPTVAKGHANTKVTACQYAVRLSRSRGRSHADDDVLTGPWELALCGGVAYTLPQR